MPTTLLLGVAITIYAGEFVGQPLYCDTGAVLFYDETHAWIAWDFAKHGGQCDDIIEIVHAGIRRTYKAKDSGPFGIYCVETDDGCLLIAADLPVHLAWFPGLSVQVERVRNLSETVRQIGPGFRP